MTLVLGKSCPWERCKYQILPCSSQPQPKLGSGSISFNRSSCPTIGHPSNKPTVRKVKTRRGNKSNYIWTVLGMSKRCLEQSHTLTLHHRDSSLIDRWYRSVSYEPLLLAILMAAGSNLHCSQQLSSLLLAAMNLAASSNLHHCLV